MKNFSTRLIKYETERHHRRLQEITNLLPRIKQLEPVIEQIEAKLNVEVRVDQPLQGYAPHGEVLPIYLSIEHYICGDQQLYECLIELGFTEVSRRSNGIWDTATLQLNDTLVCITVALNPSANMPQKQQPIPQRRNADLQVAA